LLQSSELAFPLFPVFYFTKMNPSGRNNKKKRQGIVITPPPPDSPNSSYKDDPWLPIIKRRRRFTPEEANILEIEYMNNPNPPQETLQSLASSMSISRKIITTWFQNRRAKNKRKAREKESDDHSDTNSTATTASAAVGNAILLSLHQEHHEQQQEQQQQVYQLSLQQVTMDHNQCYSYYPLSMSQQQCNCTEQDAFIPPQRQSYAYKEQDTFSLQQQQAYQNYIMNTSSSNLVSTNDYFVHNYLLSASTVCTSSLYVNPAELQLDYKPQDKAAPIISTVQQPSSSSSSK
jgi:hypothetical protein